MKYYKFMNLILVSVENSKTFFEKLELITESDAKKFNKFIICSDNKLKNTKSYYKLLSKDLVDNKTDGLNYLFSNETLLSTVTLPNWLEQKISEGKCSIYNMAYGIENLIQIEKKIIADSNKKKRVNVLGLGDVGGILLIGLKLLGTKTISEIGIYDLDENKLKRWEAELNQIIDFNNLDMPKIKLISNEELFDCDMFIFSASKGVPKVGSDIKDVRQYQLESNSKIISIYAKMARERNFKGIFAVVSDPVDELCNVVYKESNKNEYGETDYKGILPEKIKGYGLGVMHGRALYYSDKLGINSDNIRVYGPHGKNLIIANDVINYSEKESIELTNKTINANMDIREYGYKPFIAPAISSGAVSIINTLQNKWHYSAVFAGGCYFGIKNRETLYGIEVERLKVDEKLYKRISSTHKELLNE